MICERSKRTIVTIVATKVAHPLASGGDLNDGECFFVPECTQSSGDLMGTTRNSTNGTLLPHSSFHSEPVELHTSGERSTRTIVTMVLSKAVDPLPNWTLLPLSSFRSELVELNTSGEKLAHILCDVKSIVTYSQQLLSNSFTTSQPTIPVPVFHPNNMQWSSHFGMSTRPDS